MPKRIQMSRQKPWRAENPDAVIVARPSKWGNPYKVGEPTGWYGPDDKPILTDHTFAMILFKSLANADDLWWDEGEQYLTREVIRRELGGRDLACWCPLDRDCHADALLQIANRTTPDSRSEEDQ